MYKVKTKAETGYIVLDSKDVGGSIVVKYNFKEYDTGLLNFCKSLTDSLDHCLITDLDNSRQYSRRFILIENTSKSFLIDVCNILYKLSDNSKEQCPEFHQLLNSITVHLNNESYTSEFNSANNHNVIKQYNIEG